MSDSVVDVDQFAHGIEEILNQVSTTTEEVVEEGVRKGAKEAAKVWSKGAPRHYGNYAKSISSHMDNGGTKPEAHAYSKMPGLPHLLEHGHATMGGGHTKAYVHVAPAAEEGFKTTLETIENGLDNL